MRLDDRVHSGWFAEEQGLRQGCVLVLLLFELFFVTVRNVTYTRFKGDKYIMDALGHLGKNKGAGGKGNHPPERQPWRRRFGACFMLKMPELYRNRPSN